MPSSSSSVANKPKRIVWLDYARALAILTVIICHSTEALYSFTLEGVARTSTVSQICEFTLFTIGRLGVPLFLFMTGYLMLDRQYDKNACIRFWKTKWCGLLLATEIWIVIYDLFLSIVNHTPLDPLMLLRNMLFLEKVAMGHMWYMPIIIGLYLFLPFIANGLKQLDDARLLKFPLGIMCLIVFLVPVISILFQCFGNNGFVSLIADGFSGGAYGCYLLIGYCVKKKLFEKSTTKALVVFGATSFVVTVALQMLAYEKMVLAPVWYNNGLLMVAGLCLFVLLSRLTVAKEPRAIWALSYYSFALYLVHFPVKMILSPLVAIWGLPNHLIAVLALSSIVIVVSLAICYLIGKIPVIGKRMLYLK